MKPHVYKGKRYTGWELIKLHRKRAERKRYLRACAEAILHLTHGDAPKGGNTGG